MINVEVKGFDKLQRELREAQRALDAIDGEVAKISFSPSNPESVETAIREMESAIDAKVAPYGSNRIVEKFVKGMKERYRVKILELAQAKTEA